MQANQNINKTKQSLKNVGHIHMINKKKKRILKITIRL